jgi:hypothetical protein
VIRVVTFAAIVCALAQPVAAQSRSLQDHSPRELLSMSRDEWVSFISREQCGHLRTIYDEFGGVFPRNVKECFAQASASYNRFQASYPLLQFPSGSAEWYVGYCVHAMIPHQFFTASQSIPASCIDYARKMVADTEAAGG